MASRFLLALALAIELLPSTIDAANDNLLVTRQWLTRDGLPQNSVLTIAEAPNGYLWLGTFDGLVRFDGVRFKTFAPVDHPELGGATIGIVQVFSNGDIWIGSNGGTARLRNNVFETVALDTVTDHTTINGLVELSSGAALVCTWDQLIVIDDGGPTLIGSAPPEFTPLQYLGRNHEDRVFVYGSYDTVFEVPSTLEELRDFDLSSAVPYQEPEEFPIWAQTWSGPEEAPQEIVTHYTEMIHRWPFTRTLQMRPGSDDSSPFHFWVSFHQPLRVFFEGKNWLHASKPVLDFPDVVSGIPDSAGNVWIGLDGGGLLRLRRKRAMTLSKEDGLATNNIMTMSQDAEGRIWAGAVGSQGGLTWIDPDTDKIELNPNGWSPKVLISSILSSRDGTVWIGSAGWGLHLYRDDAFEPAEIPESVRAFDQKSTIASLFEDSQNRIWVGSRDSGIAVLDGPRSRDFTVEHGMSHDRSTGITETPDGTIWVATLDGLNAISPEGTIRTFDVRSGLPVSQIHCIFTDSQGRLMLGTVGGGLVVQVDGRFVSIRRKNGMIDDIIAQIIEDDQGAIWVAGNRGIARLDPRSLDSFLAGESQYVRSNSFGSEEGMLNEECGGGYQPATLKTPDGQLWFASVGGIVRIDPSDFATPKSPPKVNVEEVTVDERDEIATTDRLAEVPPGARNVEIRYTGIDFGAPEDLTFRYRLVPYDMDWVEAGNRRAAFYTGVPPGEYQFEVEARGSSGDWSLQPASLTLEIAPSWWQTTTFKGIAFGSAASIVYSFVWLNSRSRRRHEILKERFSRELVELQEKERSLLATELHDGLGQNLMVIKRQVSMALDTPHFEEKATRRLEQISEAASLAVDDVRSMARRLRPYELDRLGLIQAIESVALRIAEVHPFQLELDLQPVDFDLDSRVETHIFRIVQESLTNAAKHADATHLSVASKRRERSLFFTVADDGKGMEDPTGALSSGLGVVNMTERARWIGGELQFTSRPNQGLRVTLRVPLNASTLKQT